MLNQYPLWKYVVIALVIVPGLLYAVPNLFGDDPGIQIRGSRGLQVEAALLERTQKVLDAESIATRSMVLDEQGLKVRFLDTEAQLRARDVLARELGDRYTIALTLLPATPSWLESVDARPMYLGLDLRGGVHFLMEVDVEAYLQRAEENLADDFRRALRENDDLKARKIRYASVRRPANGGVEIKLRSANDVDAIRDAIDLEFTDIASEVVERAGDTYIIVRFTEAELTRRTEAALKQNQTALRNRIDQLGVAEPVVQRQGDRRIVVQLPGVQDTARAKVILGRTATLAMHLVDEEHDVDQAASGSVPPGSQIYRMRDGRSILLKKRMIYSGDNIEDAAASIDTQSGGPIVSITLDSRGASINQRVTGENIGRRMAVVYLEEQSELRKTADGAPVLDAEGKPIRDRKRIEEVITAPVIRDQLGKRFQIEGIDSIDEARDLALLLRAGSLAAPVRIIEERTVGASLGQENINQGFRSVVIGFALVLVFMVIYYRVFGAVANMALALNLVLIVAVLSLFQATLTLPGVAGIVLTVGMAVDANVLIFERIREELRNGNSPQASIHVGYDRALSTIVDANITTLIAAVVLFEFGTGPIKGFAVTLSIGILTSMFTAIMGTRAVINLIYGGRRVQQLAI